MPKSKLTLIVDGNWLLMSRLSVLSKKFIDDYELNQELKLMLVKSINVVLRTFPLIDNIIFVADAGSWRNDIEIPDFLIKEKELEGQSAEYKGNRIKSDDINWDLLFASYDEFITKLKECGITASQETGVEGDDWCYHWSTLLNSQGTNCIIWTKDNDLKQLVKIDGDKCFTAWWNADNGLFLKTYTEDEFNFLFNTEFNVNEEILNELISKSKSVTKINPSDIVIEKIIKGDAGDNIYPIILKKSNGKSDRKFKVSSKDIDYQLNYNDDNEITNYIEHIINSKNYIGKIEKPEKDIITHFKYNRMLVALQEDSYPDSIKQIFENYNDYYVSKDIKNVEEQLQAESNKLKGILDII